MIDNLNHVVPFIIFTTIAVFALAHVLAYLAGRIGLSAVVRFFSLP